MAEDTKDQSCDKPTGKAGIIVADPEDGSMDTLV